MKSVRATIALAASLIVCFSAVPASAQVSSLSTGCNIVGSTLTVSTSCGGTSTATFVSSGSYATANASSVIVRVAIDGDTEASDWLVFNNQAPPCELFQVIIDLAGTDAVFDMATPNPGTPDSGPGVDGVITVSGPAPSYSTNDTLWNDPSNQGDLYTRLIIDWDPGVFLGGGRSYYFQTDTDSAAANTPPTANAGEDQSMSPANPDSVVANDPGRSSPVPARIVGFRMWRKRKGAAGSA